jgi:hypothetical protein
MSKKKLNAEAIENLIREKQKTVDYDIKEFTIEILVQKYLTGLEEGNNDIFIPDYQRAFVWEPLKQSKFIESIILGIPIPYIFSADMIDGRLEIIDGSQRLRTLARFINSEFALQKLEVLEKCNGLYFKDFSISRQKKIKNTSLRMIVLSDKSDEDARFMLFERINTGSNLLNDMEKRRGIFQGKFLSFLSECANLNSFKNVTSFTTLALKRREPEELILRFFTFSDRYKEFTGKNLNIFLNNYLIDKNKSFNKVLLKRRFNEMCKFVDEYFPNGFLISKNFNSTPKLRFEAISVGVYLALKEKPNLKVKNVDWVQSSEFEDKISGGSTNSYERLRGRIEYVKEKLLKAHAN